MVKTQDTQMDCHPQKDFSASVFLNFRKYLLFDRYFPIDVKDMCKFCMGFLKECNSTSILT